MDYFIVVNGQKQGPFDLVGLIKKVKNGSLTPETLVSGDVSQPFIPASQVAEIMQLLKEHSKAANAVPGSHREVKLTFTKYFGEGIDLWVRHVISFSLATGFILIFTFFMSKAFENIPMTHNFVGNMIITFFAALFYMIFFYVVLLAKRSQRPDFKETISTIRHSLPSAMAASFIISLISIASIFGPMIGFLAWIGASLVLSYFVFVPFILFDGGKKLGGAAQLSFTRVTRLGLNNLGVILLLAIFNIIMTYLPAMFSKDLLGFGLFVSMPVTVSAYAFIYDEIFG